MVFHNSVGDLSGLASEIFLVEGIGLLLGDVADDVDEDVGGAVIYYGLLKVFVVFREVAAQALDGFSRFKNVKEWRGIKDTDNAPLRPVETVRWDQIRGVDDPASNTMTRDSFLTRLRTRTHSLAFDLPSEARWEYACRAGTTTALYNGKNLSTVDECEALNEIARNYANGWGVEKDIGLAKKYYRQAADTRGEWWGIPDAALKKLLKLDDGSSATNAPALASGLPRTTENIERDLELCRICLKVLSDAYANGGVANGELGRNRVKPDARLAAVYGNMEKKISFAVGGLQCFCGCLAGYSWSFPE